MAKRAVLCGDDARRQPVMNVDLHRLRSAVAHGASRGHNSHRCCFDHSTHSRLDVSLTSTAKACRQGDKASVTEGLHGMRKIRTAANFRAPGGLNWWVMPRQMRLREAKSKRRVLRA